MNKHANLRRIALLCLGYAISGKLALLLAIPPGYATAIFPPAGIAVAALLLWGLSLWPGIFLGSLLLNLWTSLEISELNLSSATVAFSAATGAALQAVAGALLVRRFVGFPTALAREGSILRFMVLAGPLSCLINATAGASALTAMGVIAPASFGFSWFTWWVGDSIGVLVTAPLMLVAFAQPRDLWRARRNRVAVPLLLGVIGVVSLFLWASRAEQAKIDARFREIASDIHTQLRDNLERYLDSVSYLERFLNVSGEVSRDSFRYFVAYPLASKPGIQGLSWNPLVPDAEREAFERAVRRDGWPDFQIRERDRQGQLVRAAARSEYVAVRHIEPFAGNESAFGFDVASTAERLDTLRRARDEGVPLATQRITLVQAGGEQAGFLMFQPVYRGAPGTVEERRKALRGFAVGVFRVNKIVESALNAEVANRVILRIEDVGEGARVLVYGPKDPPASALREDELKFGGRRWVARYTPSALYLNEQRTWQAWGILAAGLLFVSLLGVFLLTITGHTHHMERMVARRTAELRGILDNAVEGIVTLDSSGKVESLNPAGAALFGYAAPDLIGGTITAVVPDFPTLVPLDSQARLNSGPSGSRHESLALKKDGTRIPIEIAISSVVLPDRTVLTAIIHDVSERQRVERMKDEFIATVSHELRTPLTSIKGVLSLLKSGVLAERPAKAQSLLVVGQESCDRLARLVNDLLAFSQRPPEPGHYQLAEVSLNALVAHAVTANQGYAGRHGVSLVGHPTAEDARVRVDEEKLVQALSHVLSNAVNYSPPQGTVQVSARRHGGEARIEVKDDGPGIPLEFQARIFEKFAQADSSDTRRVGGTGLGLAIAKALVEQHGGRVSFVCPPGQGTTFFIDLPLAVENGS